MVICHKHNFIFLRVPKNASTSLATWFVKNCCGKLDSYTGINDSKIKTNNIDPAIIKKHRGQYHYIHMTLQEIVDEGIVTLDDAFSKKVIGVVRDPLERQLSLFFFKRGTKGTVSDFRKEFRFGCHEHDINNQIPQSDYFKINGEIHDHSNIWLFDEIDVRLENFAQENNINVQHPINRYKSSNRPKVSMESLIDQYYDSATRTAVRQYYMDDIYLIQKLKEQRYEREQRQGTVQPE